MDETYKETYEQQSQRFMDSLDPVQKMVNRYLAAESCRIAAYIGSKITYAESIESEKPR